MKILIIGCNGQLGQDMVTMCRSYGHEITTIDYPDIDITKREMTDTVIKKSTPNLIINCAAYTAVDDCESNQKKAYSINADGIENIAAGALHVDSGVVHFSTDYVFNGKKGLPYIESDPTNPESVYGKSKRAGEIKLSDITPKHYIFRIAWLYGAHGANFVKTIHRIALRNKEEKKPLRVVNDQFGTPTWTKDICRQVLSVITDNRFGIYHCTGEGVCSWYDFACAIVKAYNIDVTVEPCTTEEFPRPAPRPPFSVLENNHLKSLGINLMPHWQDSFGAFMQEIRNSEIL